MDTRSGPEGSRAGVRFRRRCPRSGGYCPPSVKAFSLTFSLHPGAERDIADAMDFYVEQAGPLVAQRFLSEFERVAELLVENPGFGTPTTRGRRVFSLRVFPYSVVYRSLEGGVRIVVVRHQRTKPGYGGARRQLEILSCSSCSTLCRGRRSMARYSAPRGCA